MGLVIRLALGKPSEGFEGRSILVWLEFQQDPSSCLLGNRLQKDKDGSREIHYEALAKTQVRGDGGLGQALATRQERSDWILGVF